MTGNIQELTESFRFDSDEAEARFYDEVEREIIETLASNEPLVDDDEVDRGVRRIITRALASRAAKDEA